jgi:hypothetical protein
MNFKVRQNNITIYSSFESHCMAHIAFMADMTDMADMAKPNIKLTTAPIGPLNGLAWLG